MATYYPSSGQRDATSTTYLPGSYQDTPVVSSNMMMYVNSGSYMDILAGNSHQQSHCVEIATAEATDSESRQQELSSLGGSRIHGHDINGWRDGRNEMLVVHSEEDPSGVVNGGQNLQSQGLSLSLGTQIPPGVLMGTVPYRTPDAGVFSSFSASSLIMGNTDDANGVSRDDQSQAAGFLIHGFSLGNHDLSKVDMSQYRTTISRTVISSGYLKAARELLDEVVNVRTALKQPDKDKNQNANKPGLNGASSSKDGENELNDVPSDPQGSTNNSKSELSHAEKQELQNKLTKLLSMLDEVDRRYKQYYHQMQIVVSSFDTVAGCGAAKPYTALAQQTISRHFRCLHDAINGQIQATRKSLGEQDSSEDSKGVRIARLRYVDQHLRQQKALHQFGMLQQPAWRPQRGLPESSVSILRAWLFEHFLHPYPKDSDKIMLARQTGLTRSQVSNWFINARVRLWKPMVEEMYKEEIGDVEMDSISSSENVTKTKRGDKMISEDKREEMQQSATSTANEKYNAGQLMDSKSNHNPNMEMGGSSAERGNFQIGAHRDAINDYGLLKLIDAQKRPSLGDCNLFPNVITHPEGVTDRFMASSTADYQMSELMRFGSGNNVSLTLGLQHCEDGMLPMSGTAHHSFVPGHTVYNSAGPSAGVESTDFEHINPGNKQNRFSSSHLLHDFVA